MPLDHAPPLRIHTRQTTPKMRAIRMRTQSTVETYDNHRQLIVHE